jgi:hypothetical protein
MASMGASAVNRRVVHFREWSRIVGDALSTAGVVGRRYILPSASSSTSPQTIDLLSQKAAYQEFLGGVAEFLGGLSGVFGRSSGIDIRS